MQRQRWIVRCVCSPVRWPPIRSRRPPGVCSNISPQSMRRSIRCINDVSDACGAGVHSASTEVGATCWLSCDMGIDPGM